MSNTLLTIDFITNEALRHLENQLTFTKHVNRDFQSKFAVPGAKNGTSIRIRKPAKLLGRSGATLSVEDLTETNTTLTLAQEGADLSFTSVEKTFSLDEYSDRVIKPAMITIANKVDVAGLALYKDVYNTVGTPGTTPNAALTYLQAGAKLDNEAAPKDDMRAAILNPLGQAYLVDAVKGLFQSSDKIANQYNSGNMGVGLGFKFSMDQNVATHTVGPLGGTPLVNGADQTGASLITDGWTAAAAARLKQGDVFTIAGVYAVNPVSGNSTGELRQFVVTADVSSDGSGNLTAAISPSIVTSGAFKTVTASPADNAAITVLGSASTVSPQMLVFHKDAFTMACVELDKVAAPECRVVKDEKLGLSIRMIRTYDYTNDKEILRCDIMYGWKAIRPEFACRVAA